MTVPAGVLWAAIPLVCFAAAFATIGQLRRIEDDRVDGRRTLARSAPAGQRS